MGNTTQASARERIEAILDDNSFVEIGAGVKARATDFNMQEKDTPADGVMEVLCMYTARIRQF